MEKKDIVEKILNNIRTDRAFSSALLSQLVNYLLADEERFRAAGSVASKLIENLTKSNQQLVQMYEIFEKKSSSKQEDEMEALSEGDIDDIFQEIQDAQNEIVEQTKKLEEAKKDQ